MGAKEKINTNTPDKKVADSAVKARTPELAPSMDTPIGRILHLQRTIGNQAMQRMIKSGFLQTKLKIGQPGDIYEQEADHVADQVMRISETAIQPKPTAKQEERYKDLAFDYIGYWYNAGAQAVNELPNKESDLEKLLVHGGSLLWAFSPLLATSPLGLSLIGAAGAEMAILGSTDITRHPDEEIKKDIIDNLELLEHKLEAEKETPEFVEKVEKNYGIYTNERVAVWHTIFPNIGFQNRTQIKQNIKASALQTIYERAGGGITEMAKAGDETTIAAIAEAGIEYEHWQRSWGSKEPDNRDRVQHFNETFRTIKSKFSPKAGTVGPLFGIGSGAFKVLDTDAQGNIMVNFLYQPFFDKASEIYNFTIRTIKEAKPGE